MCRGLPIGLSRLLRLRITKHTALTSWWRRRLALRERGEEGERWEGKNRWEESTAIGCYMRSGGRVSACLRMRTHTAAARGARRGGTFTRAYAHAHARTHACTHTHMHAHIYVHTHLHTHVQIHAHTFTWRGRVMARCHGSLIGYGSMWLVTLGLLVTMTVTCLKSREP